MASRFPGYRPLRIQSRNHRQRNEKQKPARARKPGHQRHPPPFRLRPPAFAVAVWEAWAWPVTRVAMGPELVRVEISRFGRVGLVCARGVPTRVWLLARARRVLVVRRWGSY